MPDPRAQRERRPPRDREHGAGRGAVPAEVRRLVTRRPVPPLVPGWIIVDGLPVYHRVCLDAGPGADAIVHVHGFGISGTYLEPTAARLAPRHRTFVPDLPGMGRSLRPERPLDVAGPCPSSRLVLRHGWSRSGDVCRQLVGLPDHHRGGHDVSRPHRASRAGIARRGPEQPTVRPRAWQMAADGPANRCRWCRSPYATTSASACYRGWSLFKAMTRYPTLERVPHLHVPTLVIAGDRDPLVRIDRAGVFAGCRTSTP